MQSSNGLLLAQPLTPVPTQYARRSARMLLAAWNSADLRQIQNAIDQARAADIDGLSAAELERMEVVREIGFVMREWMAGHKTVNDLKASLLTLRHLANFGPAAADAMVAFR